jgi:hypothetical protein
LDATSSGFPKPRRMCNGTVAPHETTHASSSATVGDAMHRPPYRRPAMHALSAGDAFIVGLPTNQIHLVCLWSTRRYLQVPILYRLLDAHTMNGLENTSFSFIYKVCTQFKINCGRCMHRPPAMHSSSAFPRIRFTVSMFLAPLLAN